MVRATQQWRRHSFFRKALLGDAGKQLGLPEGARVTCAHLVELKPRRDEDAITMGDVDEATSKQLKEPSIKALVVVGDDGGRVVVCDGHLASPSFLPPFDDRSLHVHAVTRGSEKDVAEVGAVVAAVGSNDDSFLLRTFAVSDDGAFAGGVAELPLSKDTPASLALRNDGRLCAIGLESGSVTLVSVGASIACTEDDLSRNPVAPGDKPRFVDFADAAARRIGRQLQTDKADQLLVVCGSVKPPRSAPCVALAFASFSDETYLFVGSQVRRFEGDRVESDDDDDDDAGGQVCCSKVPETISGTLPSSVLDERGCGPGLMAYDGEKVIVARSDGLYLYATDERRGALGFDGPKTALACLGDGLVAVAAVGRYKRSEVTIYDIVQRRVVHFARLSSGVAAACLLAALSRKPPEPEDYVDGRRPLMKPLASVIMLATDGSVVRYDEKSTPEKLDGLYKERSYASAVDVALKSGLPKRAAAQIFRMYGDHLCDQSQYGEAAIQYAHTIGTVQPSYVVQKFLNARKFEELAAYLLKAHGRDATQRQFVLDDPYGLPRPIEELDELRTRPELTTLLINCYAKLKDVAALDRFVKNEDDLAVDGATAVVALRDAGYYGHAEKAAEAYDEWAWRCVLALERDPWRPEDALEFFDRMDVLSRFRCVRRFGVRLVKDFPDRTTELLMRLATAPDVEVDDCIRPEDENTPVCYEEELQLRKEEARQKRRPTTPQAFPPDSDSDDEGFTCDDFPHFFVHRPGHLRLFCDYVMNFDQRGRTRNICTTLVELLVDEWRSLKDNNSSVELLEQKAEDIMALLRSDAPYDRMVALVLVETREFPFVAVSVILGPSPRPRRRGDGVLIGPRRHDVVDAAVRVYASRERTAVSPRHNVHAPRRPGTLYLYETKFAQEPVEYEDRKEPWWTRRQKRRSQKFRDAVRPEERVIPHGLRNGILVQEYHKRGRIGDMLRICRAEGRSDPLLWILACQTTAGAIPPEVLKRKRYFGLGDDKAEVWDPDAAREADEHTARCANEGYEKEGFVDSDYVRFLCGNHRASRRRRVTPPPRPRAVARRRRCTPQNRRRRRRRRPRTLKSSRN